MNDAPAAARYVAGQMSDPEIAKFEAEMLSRPELAADVNVRQRIKAGLELLEERRELAAIVSGHAARPQHSRFALAAGFAALALTVSLTWWYTQSAGPSHLIATDEISQAAGTRSFLLGTIRGGTPTPLVDVPAGTEFVELRLMVDGQAGGAYEVRLDSRAPSLQASVGGDGLLTVGLRLRGLDSGPYYLSVTSNGQAKVEEKFPFQLEYTR